MMRAAVGLALCFGFISLSPAALANSAPQDSGAKGAALGSCSIHIWQRGIYTTDSGSNLGAFGLVGALLQAEYDRKYPAATVEGVMEDVLNIDALPATIASIPWSKYTGTENNNLVFERGFIDNDRFNYLKSNAERNSGSKDTCYIEIYIGKQTFSGSRLKSHLFSDFYVRTFYDGVQKNKGAILWDQTRYMSVADADGQSAAKRLIADGFVATLTKFLDNKLPKRI